LFDPLRFPVVRAPGPGTPQWSRTAAELIAAHASTLAAVVIEPLVQGAGGMLLSTPDEVARIAAACRAHDVLLVHDEVATGFGRTGTLFATDQCPGARPDLLCLGKGITGGYLPMSVTVAAERVYAAFLGPDLSSRTFHHGHSYGGNALAAAVARRHLELLNDGTVIKEAVARAEQFADLLAQRIAPRADVAEVRQRGLMIGVELAPPTEGLRWGRRVCVACVRRGVLLRPLGDVVVIMPMLTTTPDEAERIVTTLEAALDEVCA
ncbi:MAG TPA: aminotransferase class III-fold pyridoxal phosphate-dependent enzyme, partial [Acidimicrobiales bacterium]|nr:aminotransferase class III-fold pyridoxal phosphate-dependent enzyme [Acidimicrobiales bacterium]